MLYLVSSVVLANLPVECVTPLVPLHYCMSTTLDHLQARPLTQRHESLYKLVQLKVLRLFRYQLVGDTSDALTVLRRAFQKRIF